MLNLEKRRLRGDRIALFKYTGKEKDLFLVIPECRTHNIGLKLQETGFMLNTRKKS